MFVFIFIPGTIKVTYMCRVPRKRLYLIKFPVTSWKDFFRRNLCKTWDTVLKVTKLSHKMDMSCNWIGSQHRQIYFCNKTPVLLLHGILDCSVTWIAAGPGVGLGFVINHLYFFIFRQYWTKERLKFVFAYP